MEGERLERQYRQITGNYITVSEECPNGFSRRTLRDEEEMRNQLGEELPDELKAAKIEDWVVLGK